MTNVIDTMPAPHACNFVERDWLFAIPEAGEYDFGMSGQGESGAATGADKMTFLDGLSIHRVTEELDAKPVIPNDLVIKVADGARLVLNYTGTNVVRRVKVGSRSLPAGIVNAERYPQVVGGMGALLVEPNGTMIVVR